MWQQTYSESFCGISADEVFAAWQDVDNWPKWDRELERCELKQPFAAGSSFLLKANNGPEVKIHLSKVITNQQFTDYCRFPGATMYDDHQLQETADGVVITNTITVKGPLAFIWRRLVVQKVADSVPEQTQNLIKYLKNQHD